MLMVLKVTLHIQPTPKKHIYQAFQWVIYVAEGRDWMNLPGKNSIIGKVLSKVHIFQGGLQSDID